MRHRVRRAACVLLRSFLFFALLVSSAPARDTNATLEEAVAVYAEALDTEDRDLRLERFRQSERLFAAAAAEGNASADLYANLGNAALQAEHLGNAVLAYRRALVLDPDHERAGQNLDHVRGLLPDWVPRHDSPAPFDSFFFWHRTLSSQERSLGAALSFAAAGLLLAAGIAFRSTLARNLTILPALVWASMVASLAMDRNAGADNAAVVTTPETIARSADSMHAPARFSRPLPVGTEVEVLEQRDEWLRIELANGREAWVRTSAVTVVSTI